MRHRILAFALALAALLGLIGVASPAQAALLDCPNHYFCLWTGTGYTGARYQWSYAQIDATARNGFWLGSGVSNRGYSFYNRSGTTMNIYDDPNCAYSPWTRTMANGQYANAAGSDWGGRVSSIQFETSAPAC